jgi:hypothetical protein
MIGQHVGRVVAKHDKGYGWIVDENPGSPTQNTTFFFHPKNVNGHKYIANNTRITFDLIPDPKNSGSFIAGNIDSIEITNRKVTLPESVVRVGNPSVQGMFAGDDFDPELHISCPVCGTGFTKIVSVEEVNSRPNYRDRAWCICVKGESCGHTFNIIFQRHKGVEFLEVEVVTHPAITVTAPADEKGAL